MAKRKHKTRPAAAGEAGAKRQAGEVSARAPVSSSAPDLLRRGLLGLITALLVARPLVLGEDPGLLDRLSDTSNLVLTLLWFVAAAGWAVWRAWSGEDAGWGGWVEAGLVALVGVVFLGAGAVAAYQHPAWLIAWEWLALLAVFVLVRRLARTPEERHGLLAAVLATGVSVAAYGIYQAAVELPDLRATYGSNLEELREALSKQNLHLDPDDPNLRYLARRIQESHAYGTFAHPNSFAGYLALLLPPAVGLAVAAWRRWPQTLGAYLMAGCALVLMAGLWLSHSQGAILGCLLVGLGAAAVAGRRWLAAHKGLVLAAAAVVAAIGIFVVQSGLSRAATGKDAGRSVQVRLEYWAATWRMISDHPWLGVGPGQFGRYYPRYLPATAAEKIQDPHNFLLELAAVCGVLGLAAIVVTFAVFFWSVVRSPWSVAKDQQLRTTDKRPRTPWEFYLGGIAGLLVGFVLRASGLAQEEVLLEGVNAGLRSLVWFVAFPVLLTVPVTERGLRLGAAAGVAALLLNLLVSGGIGFPSVAQPLWALAALALPPLPFAVSRGLPRMLPLPLTAGLCVAYFALVFSPVAESLAALKEARRGYLSFVQAREFTENERLRPVLAVLADAPPAPFPASFPPLLFAVQRSASYGEQEAKSRLLKPILEPLVRAAQADPGNVLPRLELAQWYGELWKLDPSARSAAMGGSAADAAIAQAVLAAKCDPEGKDGYLAEYRLWKLFADRVRDEQQRRLLHQRAAQALRRAVECDPTEARLHYQLAEALFQAKDVAAARQEADVAWKFDQLSTEPGRQLNEQQREQLRSWRGK